MSCACWCSSSTHSGLLHEPNTFTLCCHGDLKWAAPLLLLLPPPPPLLLLWFPSPWLLLLPPRLPLSASSPLVAGLAQKTSMSELLKSVRHTNFHTHVASEEGKEERERGQKDQEEEEEKEEEE